ncbi:MAG: pyridoxamine 5'-phosphate oxidase family protein [Ilumatobacter sp.]|nr:pyridoxamine 5'-phosphate oxidase family protein [Ilumatobacter sp.]
MDETIEGTEILDEQACWERLRRTSVGRLAVDNGGQPEIFPINYVVDDQTVVFRTKPGTKLAAAVLLQRVAFEIDGYEPTRGQAWSVVIKGRARSIERMRERYDAEDLPLFPWAVFPKPEFVRIVPVEVTGRRFFVAEEVVTDGSIGWTDARGDDAAEELAVVREPGAEQHPGEPKLHPN